MKPLQLGVTGGIGSGKSVVCRIFEELGIPVYNADIEAKRLLEADMQVREKVILLLGKKAYSLEGTANRSYIASLVFADDSKLEELNNIIHPAVQNDYLEWVSKHVVHPIVIKEAAIMFESGSYKGMDYIVAVIAPEEMRIKRVMNRDGKTKEQVRNIMAKQLPETELIKRSKSIIINNDKIPVLRQVLELLQHLKQNKIK